MPTHPVFIRQTRAHPDVGSLPYLSLVNSVISLSHLFYLYHRFIIQCFYYLLK